MEEEKLRSFIQDNRDDFEKESPGKQVWKNIESEFKDSGVRTVPIRRLYSIVAALVIIFGLGLTYLLNRTQSDNIAEETNKTEEVEMSISELSDDLAEVETYYVSEVNSKMKELEQFDVDNDLLEEIELLSEEFDELKAEMGQTVDLQRIVEAMIENYRLRLEILEDLLKELKEENKQLKTKQNQGNEMA